MYGLIRDWQSCGQSQHAFCQARGVSHSKFKYWHQKYRLEHGLKQSTPSGSFIAVEVESPVAAPGAYHLHFPNGIELGLPKGMCMKDLATLIQQF